MGTDGPEVEHPRGSWDRALLCAARLPELIEDLSLPTSVALWGFNIHWCWRPLGAENNPGAVVGMGGIAG